jgi:hypothetical protein
VGGKVTGIGQTQHEEIPQVLESRCTQGRFQLGFAQPVYVGSNEAQEGPPDGAPVGSSHSITFYSRQLAEGSPEGKPFPTTTRLGISGMKWATAGPHTSPPKSTRMYTALFSVQAGSL